MDYNNIPLNEVKSIGLRTQLAMENRDIPIGGGYTAASEIKPATDTAFTKLSKEEQVLVDKQIDTNLRLAQQEKNRQGVAPAYHQVASALAATDKTGIQRAYIENYVNSARDSLSTPQSIIVLKQNEVTQQRTSDGRAR